MSEKVDCPFCGAPESNLGFVPSSRRWRCDHCGALGPPSPNKTSAKARWRRRPLEEDLRMRLKNAQAEIKFQKIISEDNQYEPN